LKSDDFTQNISRYAESSPALKTWEIRRNHSYDQLIKGGFLQLCVRAVYENVMDPLQQSVALVYVIFFFVHASLVVRTAVITIADHQRLQVAWQASAE
jgi:hypothetical protein